MSYEMKVYYQVKRGIIISEANVTDPIFSLSVYLLERCREGTRPLYAVDGNCSHSNGIQFLLP